MMNKHLYNLYDAKTHLSNLVERAAEGEEIIIAKAGYPMAKLVPIEQKKQRKPGCWKDKVWISDDFDAPLPDEILDAFEGKS